MSDQFVDAAKERMNFLEELVKGLPGIRGYVDKELRRDADKRLRELIAGELEEQKQALFAVQQLLLEGKGLLWMDNVDSAVSKLQLLADRIRTASYGYAGLFDAVRIGENELNALNHFDQMLAERVADVRTAIQNAADGGRKRWRHRPERAPVDRLAHRLEYAVREAPRGRAVARSVAGPGL